MIRMEEHLTCSVCEKKGDIFVLEKKNDLLICPKCGASWKDKGKVPLGRYQEEWIENSNYLFALLRPELPSNIILTPGLKALYEDCYHTLLIGRYNASIVMRGVLLEAMMNERIRLKTGKDFSKPYGACIDRLMGIRRNKGRIEQAGDGCSLVALKDILFLDKFRDKVRNQYAHFDEAKLVAGRVMKGWEIPINDLTNPANFEKVMREIETGQRKPMLLQATHPALRSASKLNSDRVIAIQLFNLVYDFLLEFSMKYLRKRDYNEFHKRYPTPFTDLSSHIDGR
jgi:hypothetical protein